MSPLLIPKPSFLTCLYLRRLKSTAKCSSSTFTSRPHRNQTLHRQRPLCLFLGAGALYLYDTHLNASCFTRTARTFLAGAIIAADYKINFTAHPPFAPSIEALHARSAERIYDLLRSNGGLYLKIGQAIAMQSAILPPEFQRRFARMFDDAPQNDWEDVEKVLREEFCDHAPDEVFGVIEKTARASASIAQVHRARLRDGRIVAVKIQKREIVRQVEWDLWAFHSVMRLYSYFFDLPLYSLVPYISERLRSETDFINEAHNAERTRTRVEQDRGLRGRVYIPKVDWELTTKRVMTAEWIDGVRISDKEALTEGLGVQLADVMQTSIELFSKQIFEWGDVHCDPHPGNVLVRLHPSSSSLRPKPQVVLIDHGLYVHLTSSFREQYARFWTALASFDNTTLQSIASQWGIASSSSTEAVDMFASATLMRPYTGGSQSTSQLLSTFPPDMDDKERAFEMQERMRRNLREILGDEKKWPRELIFLSRTIRILQATNQMLGSPVNRIKIMSLTASSSLISSSSISHSSSRTLLLFSLPAICREWIRHLAFRIFLLSFDVIFYLSRIRQYFGLGGGMESDLDAAMREVARGLGVEVNHDLFEG